MRIVIISAMTGFAWGGSEELWFQMALAAIEQGHQVAVALCRPYTATRPLESLRAAGVELLSPPRINPGGRWQSIKATVRDFFSDPYQSVLDWKPDVACVSQGSSYDIGVFPKLHPLARLLTTSRFPYVVVCQANDDALTLPGPVVEVLAPVVSRAATTAFVAERNRGTLERQLATRLPHAVVVRNPVNLSDTSAVPWPGQSVPVRLACVARLVANVKGQDALLEALSATDWPRDQWRLDMYGSGDDEPHLKNLARFFGIAGNVHFRGQTDDVRKIWEENHMLVLPSRMEGTPLAMVEAMLCGRPVLATDVGGIAEWITEPATGFLAETASSKSLKAALERAWAARQLWPAMGNTAREAATKLYDTCPGKTLLSLVVAAGRTTRAPGS